MPTRIGEKGKNFAFSRYQYLNNCWFPFRFWRILLYEHLIVKKWSEMHMENIHRWNFILTIKIQTNFVIFQKWGLCYKFWYISSESKVTLGFFHLNLQIIDISKNRNQFHLKISVRVLAIKSFFRFLQKIVKMAGKGA